jgi:probable HAF family extracellular repeat protein
MGRYHRISLIAIAAVGTGLCFSIAAPSVSQAVPTVPGYTVTNLATLRENVWHVLGLNGAGQLVGEYRTGGATRAFLWDQGKTVDLGTLGGKHSHPQSINAMGQVVGVSLTASGDYDAFLWQEGQMQDLGSMDPIRINNFGQVIALFFPDGKAGHPVLWEQGTTTDLGTLGGRSTDALDLNDLGQVVGNSLTADNGSYAFLWQNGIMTNLGTLGARLSSANSINNQGEVVGESVTPTGAAHAFLWRDGRMTDLGPADGLYGRAQFINDVGQIVGLTTVGPVGRSSTSLVLWENGQPGRVLPGLNIYRLYGFNNAGQILLETQPEPLKLLLTPIGGKSPDAQDTAEEIEALRTVKLQIVTAGKLAQGRVAAVIAGIIVPDLNAAEQDLSTGFAQGAIGELKAVLRLMSRYPIPTVDGASEPISRVQEIILRLGGNLN